MRTPHSPSLLQSTGYVLGQNQRTTDNTITIIHHHYLRNLRDELLEEEVTNAISQNNKITYVRADVEGIPARIMIDTGANVSLINNTELERIQKECQRVLPTLPVNNTVLLGATGRQNKSVKKQLLLDLNSKGVVITMVFLVANGLPFNILLGCDVLRKYSAMMDLNREKVSLDSEGVVWTAELIGSERAPPNRTSYHVREINYSGDDTPGKKVVYQVNNDDLWNNKLEEIRTFQYEKTEAQLNKIR